MHSQRSDCGRSILAAMVCGWMGAVRRCVAEHFSRDCEASEVRTLRVGHKKKPALLRALLLQTVALLPAAATAEAERDARTAITIATAIIRLSVSAAIATPIVRTRGV